MSQSLQDRNRVWEFDALFGSRSITSRWRRRAAAHLRDLVDEERGDVPGWVLITLMTAGLVFVIWALAGPALLALFTQALEQF